MLSNTEKKTRSAKVTLEIDAPVENVWKALTDAEAIKNWFALDARVEPGEGGSLWWSWGEDLEWPSQIEVWQPNRHLRASYDSSVSPDRRGLTGLLVMDFHLEARGGKTILRLVHSGFGFGGSWNEEYDGVSRGWNTELRSLRHYLEHHWDKPRQLAWVRRKIALPLEEAWKLLVGPEGLLRQGTLKGLRAGDRYSLTAATGDALAGTVLVLNPPKDFCASVENINNAFFRLQLERLMGNNEAIVWLGAYDVPPAEVDAFGERWQNLLTQLFPENA